MAGGLVIGASEFEEFFEVTFDSTTSKDFAKFYPRIKKLALHKISGTRSTELFETFLSRLGLAGFDPESPEGLETFSILQSCLDADAEVVSTWVKLLSKYPEESASFLNYLAYNYQKLKSTKQLQRKLLQSHELALAAVKNSDLLQAAKNFEFTTKRRRRSCKCTCCFSGAMGIYVLIFSILGLIWLDIAENGKGSFSRSHIGKLLSNYQILDDFLSIWEHVSFIFNIVSTHILPLLQYGYNGILPLLSLVSELVQFYIPDFVGFMKNMLDQVLNCCNVLGNQVFVGTLSPESLRKLTKEALSFLWGNLFYVIGRILGVAAQVVDSGREYL